MKNLFVLFVAFTFLAACNKQEVENVIPLDNEELPSVYTNDQFDSNDIIRLSDAGLASFAIENEKGILNEGDDLLILNESKNVVSYHWDFGNGHTSTEALPNYKYEMHGYYTITLTITDAFGDTKQTSNEILVLCVFSGENHTS